MSNAKCVRAFTSVAHEIFGALSLYNVGRFSRRCGDLREDAQHMHVRKRGADEAEEVSLLAEHEI